MATDNGSEFCCHEYITKKLRVKVYFEGDGQSVPQIYSLSRFDRRQHHSSTGNYFYAYIYTGPRLRTVNIVVNVSIIVSDRTLWQLVFHDGE